MLSFFKRMVAMASHLLVLLLFSAVACSAAANTSKSPPVSPLVQSTCNATAYYDLCVATLVADPASSTADLHGLCRIAISAAAVNASATQAALAKLAATSAGGARRLFRACADKYGEARDSLVGARDVVGEPALEGNAFFAVNDAAEYASGCSTTLFRRRRGAYPMDLATREMALVQLCSIARDIITLLP